MRRRNSNSYCFLVVLASCCLSRGWGDAYVQVSLGGFSPPSVTISPGEAVYWMAVDDWGPYSISSESGAWGPRYLYDPGDVEGLQFNQAGDYFYYDAFNYNYGVVHVRIGLPNVPPTVSISSPADGAEFIAPATFTFSADVLDLDNGISDVEFYIGTDFVDDVFASPFSTTVRDLASGSYTLQAVAYDFGGASSTCSISITVRDSAASGISLGAPEIRSGQFRFVAKGLTTGKHTVLESTTNLAAAVSWTSIQTNVVTGTATTFTSNVAPGNHFFRIVQMP